VIGLGAAACGAATGAGAAGFGAAGFGAGFGAAGFGAGFGGAAFFGAAFFFAGAFFGATFFFVADFFFGAERFTAVFLFPAAFLAFFFDLDFFAFVLPAAMIGLPRFIAMVWRQHVMTAVAFAAAFYVAIPILRESFARLRTCISARGIGPPCAQSSSSTV